MSTTVASGHVLIGAQIAPALAGLAKVNAGMEATASRGQRMGKALDVAAKGAAIGLGVMAIGAFKAVNAASDLNEATNKSSVLFGKFAKTMPGFGSSVAKSLGMSRTAALDNAAGIGAMLIPMGKSQKEAAAMSARMLTLAADLGSFHNADPTDMLDRLRAGLSGESEPLKKFGIVLTEARVKAEALRLGIAKQGATLTEAQKLQARYSLAIKDAGKANGDFARTADGMANKQRILSATVQDLAASLGRALLPAATAAVGGLQGFTDWASRNQTTVKAVAIAAAALGTAILAVAGAMKVAAASSALWAAAMAANPLTLFLGAAAGAAVAIALITNHLSGGASAMDRYRAATDAAKAALDRLQSSSLDLKSAHLAHRSAVLEVKSANQALATVQQQVNAGEIKGKDASLALEAAKIRVKQANLGVQTTSKGVSDAISKERSELVAHNVENAKAIAAAKERVANAKAVIAATGGSTEAQKRLKDAEEDLARAMARASKVTADTAGNVRVAGSAAETAAVKTQNLKARMDALKSKAVSIDVNTEQAMWNVIRLVGQMAIVASKTVTLTVLTRHVKGSWNDQETIENLRKEPTKRSFAIDFRSTGTAVLERAVKLIAAARSNAGSISSGLADMIGTGVDALTGQRIGALSNSPEAQALRKIETQQNALAKTRERVRLDDAIKNAETADEKANAQQDLNDWLLEQERQRLADSLTMQEDAIRAEADAKKTAAERGLNDLTSNFNRGLISQQQYNEGLQAILGQSVGNYQDLGGLLGSAFSYGFGQQLEALMATVSNIAKLTNPAAPVLRLPAGPDTPPVTHRRAALGGIVGGIGRTDKVPLLAAPGEGVLSHRGMDNLMGMAMGGGRSGGDASFTVNVYDRTTTGMSRDAIRRLADQIAPELNRRVSMAA